MENNTECNCNPISEDSAKDSRISIQISPTTGGDFSLFVKPDVTVDTLKKLVSKKFKLSGDRISLLFGNKNLQDGLVSEYGISNGSKITLLPNVETGLTTQKPELGIMQALESLNEAQVQQFLGGKAPLNLSVRLGDYVMLIQLQLTTISSARTSTKSGSAERTADGKPSLAQASKNLQHTLRKLSTDVLTGKEKAKEGNVYSGTFSGTLNPTLQDTNGKPRRDVATIVYILNDLLSPVPEFTQTNPSNSTKIIVSPEEEIASPSTSSDNQNVRTRGKLEQLKLVMDEKREKRRQRKQKPYSLSQNDSDIVTA